MHTLGPNVIHTFCLALNSVCNLDGPVLVDVNLNYSSGEIKDGQLYVLLLQEFCAIMMLQMSFI